MNILFIMYNIFDIRNGVSNKYINFIKSIENNNNISFIMTKNRNNENNQNNQNNENINTEFFHTKIYYTKGINVPFYDKIKIPHINDDLIKSIIKEEKYIIIFNGEFFWLYDILIDIKKNNNNVLLYPSWHTDYEEYFKKYVSDKININYMMNILYDNLKFKIFNGIIVTGEYTKNKFLKYTEQVFNANELCVDNFNFLKIDKYSKGEIINFIYCGRVSIEKNIDEIFDILNNIDNLSNNYIKLDINIHIIGDGPYLETLKIKYSNHLKQIHFYNELKYDEIVKIYKKLDNRIFIMCSETETFGKAPMEAGLTGIPIFIKKFNNIQFMYNEQNAFIYETKFDFINNLLYFLHLNNHKKKEFIENSINNINKYDQKIIFHEWEQFLLHNYNKPNNCMEEIISKTKFKKFLNLIQCSMNIISE